MNFIQNQIDRGLTHLIVTLRGEKGVSNFEVLHFSDVDSVEKYNKIVSQFESHSNGISVGWSH